MASGKKWQKWQCGSSQPRPQETAYFHLSSALLLSPRGKSPLAAAALYPGPQREQMGGRVAPVDLQTPEWIKDGCCNSLNLGVVCYTAFQGNCWLIQVLSRNSVGNRRLINGPISLACLLPTNILSIYVFTRHCNMVMGIQIIRKINTIIRITNIYKDLLGSRYWAQLFIYILI